jgi:hypothetical protein
MSDAHPNELTRTEKIRVIAEAFMKEDPQEYADETIEDVMKQLEETSDQFIDFTFDTYRTVH